MNRFLLIFVACLGTALSCQKEHSLRKFTLNDATTDISYSEKSFVVSNHASLVLKTPTGSKLYFPANAFVNKLGQPITDNITVHVKEILRPDAMIWHKMPTVSGSEILESGGEFYIGVTSGTEKLKMAPGVYLKMDLPNIGIDVRDMQVFNGRTDSVTGAFSWQLNSTPGNLVARDSTNPGFDSYSLFSYELDWLNVDKFINEPKFDLTVHPGNSPNMDSTDGYIQLLGRNSLLGLINNGTYFDTKTIGGPIAIIGICRSNGVLKASIQKINISSGQSSTMNFISMSEAQLKQKLKALR